MLFKFLDMFFLWSGCSIFQQNIILRFFSIKPTVFTIHQKNIAFLESAWVWHGWSYLFYIAVFSHPLITPLFLLLLYSLFYRECVLPFPRICTHPKTSKMKIIVLFRKVNNGLRRRPSGVENKIASWRSTSLLLLELKSDDTAWDMRYYTTDLVDLAIHRVVCRKSDFHCNRDIQSSQKLDPLEIKKKKKCQAKIC
jgi:hypothetical protein